MPFVPVSSSDMSGGLSHNLLILVLTQLILCGCSENLPRNALLVLDGDSLGSNNQFEIVSHPASQTVSPGDPILLQAVFKGANEYVSYEWFKNGVSLPLENPTAELVINQSELSDSGEYYIQARNSAIIIASNKATVRVTEDNDSPRVLKQPQSYRGKLGSSFELLVSFVGIPDYNLVWYKDDQPITGANMPRYRVPDALVSDAGNYKVVIQNQSVSIESETVSVGIDRKPGSEVGSLGDDRYDGNGQNNIYYSRSGNDVIYGNGGDDEIFAGSGADEVYGNGDNDRIEAGPGNDLVFGGQGSDVLIGQEGDDELRGQEGADSLFGGPGDDIMHGGMGNDKFQADEGTDTLYGGSGNDQYNYYSFSQVDIIEDTGGERDHIRCPQGIRGVGSMQDGDRHIVFRNDQNEITGRIILRRQNEAAYRIEANSCE